MTEKEEENMKIYYSAKDISNMLDISETTAYGLIRKMNQELEKEGYLVISGKVPIAYFNRRWYGLDSIQQELQGAM